MKNIHAAKIQRSVSKTNLYAPIYQFKVAFKHHHCLIRSMCTAWYLASPWRIIKLNAMLHSPLLKTACITLLCLSSIFPQSLYNSDFQHYHILNRESREIFVEDTLANLRERTFKLEECNSRQNSTVRAYSELLRMLNTRILPNGTCSNYNYFAYYDTVVLYIFKGINFRGKLKITAWRIR